MEKYGVASADILEGLVTERMNLESQINDCINNKEASDFPRINNLERRLSLVNEKITSLKKNNQ